MPDVYRILKEGAFWDIYYEHCSYFSAISLKQLFFGTGFAVERIWTGYDDQYLMIVARPAADKSVVPFGDEDGVGGIVHLCGSFAAATAQSRAAWLSRLRNWAAAGQRSVLWGSGSKAVAFLTTLGNPRRNRIRGRHQSLPRREISPGTGQRIVAPAFLRSYRPDNVIIMNPIYLREVERELARQRCELSVYTILDVEPEHV